MRQVTGVQLGHCAGYVVLQINFTEDGGLPDSIAAKIPVVSVDEMIAAFEHNKEEALRD